MRKCKIMLDEVTAARLEYWKHATGFSKSALIRMCVNSLFEQVVTKVKERHIIEVGPESDTDHHIETEWED